MERVAFIGFGEAGRAFASAAHRIADTACFDVKLLGVQDRPEVERAARAAGVTPVDTAEEAIAGAGLVISVVTADQALHAATHAARFIARDAIYCDMNSVAPQTKRAAAAAIDVAGGRYVDVAVMSPVLPARLDAPLLLGGPSAPAAAEALGGYGFGKLRIIEGGVGRPSAIKMIRSVMVKGIEALTAECFLAAEIAGVRAEVTASLDASWPGADWAARADYNLGRMLEHGQRRAEEMEAVVATLEALGTGVAMSRGTAARQGALGALGLPASDGLDGKLARILPALRAAADGEQAV